MSEVARLLRLCRVHLDHLAAIPELARLVTPGGHTAQAHATSALRELRAAQLEADRATFVGPIPARRAADILACESGAAAADYAILFAIVVVLAIAWGDVAVSVVDWLVPGMSAGSTVRRHDRPALAGVQRRHRDPGWLRRELQ
jgi:Flp pilus assembly pilin Flp